MSLEGGSAALPGALCFFGASDPMIPGLFEANALASSKAAP